MLFLPIVQVYPHCPGNTSQIHPKKKKETQSLLGLQCESCGAEGETLNLSSAVSQFPYFIHFLLLSTSLSKN